MSGEQSKQAVVGDTNGEAKPSPEKNDNAQGSVEDLDALLSEFATRGGEESEDDGDKPPSKKSAPEKKPETDINDVVDRVEVLIARDKKREEAEQLKQVNEDMAKVVKAVRGELDADFFDDDLVDAYVQGLARKNPSLQEAWKQRHAKPKQFAKVIEQIGKNLTAKFAKLTDKSATEDREAVTAAVRGSPTKAPDAKAPDYKSMNDAEFANDIEKKHGFRPLV